MHETVTMSTPGVLAQARSLCTFFRLAAAMNALGSWVGGTFSPLRSKSQHERLTTWHARLIPQSVCFVDPYPIDYFPAVLGDHM